MDERKTGQSSGGGNKGKLPALLALVSVVLFLALVGGRIREMVSEKELIDRLQQAGFDRGVRSLTGGNRRNGVRPRGRREDRRRD